MLLLAALVALPVPAVASHMGQYANDPLQRDLHGQVSEPDGLATRVLGVGLRNCVVELPLAGAFAGRCSSAAEAHGTGLQPHGPIAPGCTGADEAGKPERRVDGQCGLWTVGAPRPASVYPPLVGPRLTGPGNLPPPVSERGMGSGAHPGRYAGTLRFLDARIDPDFVQNPTGAGGTAVVAYHRLLLDLAAGGMTPAAAGTPLPAVPQLGPLGGAVLPGQHMVWAWYGQWDDRNGNGVVDHCLNCHANHANGAGTNEFSWLGSCTEYNGLRRWEAVDLGACIEDGNPNLSPPGAACANPQSFDPCAGTTMTMWVWPGNHHGDGIRDDQPGNQVLTWAALPWGPRPLDCSTTPPTCDEVDREPDRGAGDPLLGKQEEVLFDGTYRDRTGDGADTTPPDDTVRQWMGYLGGDSMYYGDDGLLVTLLHITGVNCAETGHATGYDPATCTFLDVDRYPTLSGDAQGLLVRDGEGDPEHSDGGLKRVARGTWVLLRDRSPTLQRLVDGVVHGNAVYQASAGPDRGRLHDQHLDNGWSREPNVDRATYKDAAGVEHVVMEHYVGVRHTDCEDPTLFPVGDSRNPTHDHDGASDEAAHRGFCNVHVGGAPQPAYRDYARTVADTPSGPRQVARGWLDLQPVRGVFTDFPFYATAGACTLCHWFGTDVNLGGGSSVGGVLVVPGTVEGHSVSAADPEGADPLPEVRAPTDHRRTLGPGRYYFKAPVGLWLDQPFTQDESLFPDPVGTVIRRYPPAGDAFPHGDGWLGTVARAGGQWHYRGFTFGTCADLATDKDPGSLHGAKGRHDAAECNPYKDGNIDDPQDYASARAGGEFLGACDSRHMGPAFLAPADGVLDTQIIAIDDYGSGAGPLPHLWGGEGIFAYGPGPVDPLAIPITCNGNYLVGTTFFYWPGGAMFDDIVTWIDADIARGPVMPGYDHVRDVDHYPAYALPLEAAPPPLPGEVFPLLNP